MKFPKCKIHSGASYHSKLLPTKEITKLLQNFNFQNKTSELSTQLIKIKRLAKEKKYDDLKKALKFIIDKSEELETIITDSKLIISEEMKSTLLEIKK